MALLRPEVVAAIDDLGLAARKVVEGMRAGEHRSPFHGFNHEFSQYREYRPGDDLKYLDWKALGRTDRLYTRLFLETTNMSVVFVVDASASMGFPEELSKLRYGAIAAAALAHLVVTSGDAAGLLAASDDDLVYVPARGGRGHLQLLLQRLDRLQPAGVWRPARAVRRAAELLRRRGLLVVLSDFYDDEEATFAEMKRAAASGHEVAMMHVLSRAELDLPYDGSVELIDMESEDHRLADTTGVRDRYRRRVAAFCDAWRQRATGAGIDYQMLVTDEPPADALRRYLVRREAAAGAPHTHHHRKG